MFSAARGLEIDDFAAEQYTSFSSTSKLNRSPDL
jgi:hypothetical protein